MSTENSARRGGDQHEQLRKLVHLLLLTEDAFDSHLAALTDGVGCHTTTEMLEPWVPDAVSDALENPWTLTGGEVEAILAYEPALRLIRAWLSSVRELPEPWVKAIVELGT